jgi:hypothetical protein
VHLPEIRKKIVYIDQFAFSNIMKMLSPEVKGHERATAEPFWRELFETLSVVCHIQLVACPDSREHQHESLASAFYKSLKHTYEHFSGGVSFEDAETVKLRQVGRIAKCWLKREPVTFNFSAEKISSGRLHEWSGRIFITVDGLLPGQVDELRSVRGKTYEGIQEVFELWQKEKKPFKEVYEIEKTAYYEHLIKTYAEDCRKRSQMPLQIMRGQMPSLNDMLPSRAETQMMSLQSQFQQAVGQAEATPMLRTFFASGAMNEAPFNTIGAAMYASLAAKAAAGQKSIPNQGTVTDITLVSTLLPYCDAMFMDNGCRALLQDIPKDYRPPNPCLVFSPNTGGDFIRYLKDIRDGVTPEHLKLVEEVYGPDPLKPEASIYGVGKRPAAS